MLVVGLIGACLGAALARHFKALIVALSSIMVMTSVAAAELITGHVLVHVLLTSAWAACALQLGYLLGLYVKYSAANRKKA